MKMDNNKEPIKRCFDCAFCDEAYSKMAEYCELLERYINSVDEYACEHFVDLDTCNEDYPELLKRKRNEITESEVTK